MLRILVNTLGHLYAVLFILMMMTINTIIVIPAANYELLLCSRCWAKPSALLHLHNSPYK